MPERLLAIIEAVNSSFDALPAAIIAAPIIPWVTKTWQAVTLIITAVAMVFGAGAATAAWGAGWGTVPERLTHVEVRMGDVETDVRRTRQLLCEIREDLRSGDALSCYRDP